MLICKYAHCDLPRVGPSCICVLLLNICLKDLRLRPSSSYSRWVKLAKSVPIVGTLYGKSCFLRSLAVINSIRKAHGPIIYETTRGSRLALS